MTTADQEGITCAGHQFDIIVVADDEKTLNENARAIQHSGDTYFSNSKLEAWELKYCLNNDSNRFAWADTTNGKGVIYYMKDEWNNECPYDFKNIMFVRKLSDGQLDEESGIDTYVYTFTAFNEDEGTYVDATLLNNTYIVDVGCCCKNNIIKEYNFGYNGETYSLIRLNDIVFLNIYSIDNESYFECYSNTFGNNCYSNTFGNDCGSNTFGYDCNNNSFGNNNGYNYFGNDCNNNSFGDDCNNNPFGDDCIRNTFGNNNEYNSFGSYCKNNTFGNNCNSNTFGDDCNSNTFGNFCYSNTFGNDCSSNTFGVECNNNSFEDACGSNTFGNSCYENTFGVECYSNTFGNYCFSNTFGNDCSSNTFGDYCSSNTFGNYCNENTFGNFCYSNTFGDECSYIKFSSNSIGAVGNYFQYNTVENGVQYVTLFNTKTASSSQLVKNYHIKSSVVGTSSSKKLIEATRNLAYDTSVALNSSGVLKIYCEADLIN